MKRCVVFRLGFSQGGKLLAVPESLAELLQQASETLHITAQTLFSPQGGQIEDINLVIDNDVIYVSEGEDFISPSPQSCVDSSQCDAGAVCDADWIRLNVGGTIFTTTRSTLTKEGDSMLCAMFAESGSERPVAWHSKHDASGAVLIDRSAQHFEPVLNYLRHGQLVLSGGASAAGVLEEARFFGVTSLITTLEERVCLEKPPDDHTPITRRELALRLLNTPTNRELRCQGLNFECADLSRLDLRYVNFKYAVLRQANLSGANLSYCNFERADLSDACLDNACLLGAKLLCVNLENASLKKCNFEDPAGSHANMEGANLKHVDLEGSHMSGVNLRVATLKNANLQNCDLRSAVLAGADLENCDLSGCDLHEANLRGANLKGATFNLMLNPLHMSQTVP